MENFMEKTDKNKSNEQIKETVRTGYAAIATGQRYSCCSTAQTSSCCSGERSGHADPTRLAQSIGL
jgi:hypothetical protein